MHYELAPLRIYQLSFGYCHTASPRRSLSRHYRRPHAWVMPSIVFIIIVTGIIAVALPTTPAVYKYEKHLQAKDFAQCCYVISFHARDWFHAMPLAIMHNANHQWLIFDLSLLHFSFIASSTLPFESWPFDWDRYLSAFNISLIYFLLRYRISSESFLLSLMMDFDILTFFIFINITYIYYLTY